MTIEEAQKIVDEWIKEKGKNKHKELIHLPYKKIIRK